MFIKDMFIKEIDRDIKGVVKIEQDDLEVIKTELEEYVVTNEMRKHFRDFFAAYRKGINENTDKIGVWVSGFFGSGKSHFIKILSYLLANEDIDGKKPIDYFIEGNKIDNPATLADIRLAISKPTDVISFNIDSQSQTSGIKESNSILNVFLKVFNEKLGFSANPHVADLERQLVEDGLYQRFKDKYEDIAGEGWVESRHKFNFRKDRVVKSLVEIGFMSEDSARYWSRSTINPYKSSVEDFVFMVKEYLDKQDRDHQIIFIVDEMGQYIGDNSDLMLNLQTITEDLGTVCRGRAWIMVTSQQDIDSITEVMGRDFSKIQGRFDTRLSLTSANVSEVIKLRILEKKPVAQDTLEILYENKETIIKNLIIFNDTAEKKKYADKKNFSEVYPFIPYQFDVLSNVLTSIREHSSSGKHLSEGERSMLALFKESAEKYKNDEEGRIVPFNIFYDALQKFLDHSHSVVISRALGNENINPGGEEDNFNVNVLKTLFLIKYIHEIEANIENITTLMVSHIDQDRVELRAKVEESLKILTGETLVQKNGEIYIFLTNEEQEINRLIDIQSIESTELTRKIGELIFTGIYPDERIRVGKIKNRYSFYFNRFIDDSPYRSNQAFAFGVRILTPNSEFNGNEASIKMQSTAKYDVYVDLPNDLSFINETRTAMRIEKFLGTPSSANMPRHDEIKVIKRREMEEANDRAKLYLEEALKNSKFYLRGDLLDLSIKDFKHNLTEALERLAETVYHKLYYIDIPKEEIDIHNLFKQPIQKQLSLGETVDNEHAIRDVLNFIKTRTRNHTTISLREVKNHFIKAPYGFINRDIEWIIVRTFIDGQIALSISGSNLSLVKDNPQVLIDYITKRQYEEKLLIEEKEEIPENLKRTLKNLTFELFKYNTNLDEPDLIIKEFNDRSEKLIDDLKSFIKEYEYFSYPGKHILEEGVDILSRTLKMNKTMDIFKFIRENKDEYLNFRDDYEPLRTFLIGQSKDIWIESLKFIDIFEASQNYLFNEELEDIYDSMKEIKNMKNPYNNVYKLPDLNEKFKDLYNKALDKETKPVLENIEEDEKNILYNIEQNNLEDYWLEKARNGFLSLKEKAKSTNNLAHLKSYVLESSVLRERLLNDIEKATKERARDLNNDDYDTGDELSIVRTLDISIQDINKLSWNISSQEDIDKYIEQLKSALEERLKDNIVLNIKF